MKQTEQTVLLRTLEADPGHVLTQAADITDGTREFTTLVDLAVSDDPANWREVSEEEAAQLRIENEKQRQAMRAE